MAVELAVNRGGVIRTLKFACERSSLISYKINSFSRKFHVTQSPKICELPLELARQRMMTNQSTSTSLATICACGRKVWRKRSVRLGQRVVRAGMIGCGNVKFFGVESA